MKILIGVITLFFAIEVFDMGDIFLFLLDIIDIYCRQVITATLSPLPMALKTFLIIPILFVVWLWWVEDYCNCFLLDISIGGMLVDLFFWKFLHYFFTSLYSWRYLALILQVFESGCSNVFASVLIAFSTDFSQESSSQPQAFNCAQMEGLRFFWKYRIKISLLGAVTSFNSLKTACRCSKYAAQSKTCSSWY